MPYNFLPIAHVHFRTLSRENSHCGSIFSAGGGALFYVCEIIIFVIWNEKKVLSIGKFAVILSLQHI